jgi:Protein of unknown function (DUF3738)
MIEHGARKPDLCRKLLLIAVLAAFCQPNVAQSQAAPQAAKAAAKVPEFEVASIKPNASGLGMMRFIFTPDGCSATNISLDFLVSNAYGISRDLISGGPSWIVSSRYDVEAKVAGADVAEWHRLEVSQRNSLLFVIGCQGVHRRFVPRERFPLSRTVFIEIVQVLEWSTENSRELKHAAPDFVFIAPCESEYEGSFPTMIHRKH